VHVWVEAVYGTKDRPQQGVPVPLELQYNLWLGPVAERPYSPDYIPASWRNWWAFGGGSLADFGCHFMDLPHWALDLRTPLTVEVLDGPPPRNEAVPPWMIVRYEYPARKSKPSVVLTWYHGGRKPSAEVLAPELAAKWNSGVLFVGKNGQLLSDYGRHLLLPEKQFEGFVPPAPFIPNSIGHYKEWAQACKTGATTTCNFGYSGALTPYGPRQWMRRMWLFLARCCRCHPHEHATTLHFHFVAGHGVILRAGLADTGDAIEFPIVPGTHHIIRFC